MPYKQKIWWDFRGLSRAITQRTLKRRAFSSLPVPFPSCFPKRSSMMAYGSCCFLVWSQVPHASSTSLMIFSRKLLMSCIPKDPCMAYLPIIYQQKSSNCREICQSPISSGYVCAFFGHCSVPHSWTNLFLWLDTTLSADVCFLAGCFSYKSHKYDVIPCDTHLEISHVNQSPDIPGY